MSVRVDLSRGGIEWRWCEWGWAGATYVAGGCTNLRLGGCERGGGATVMGNEGRGLHKLNK